MPTGFACGGSIEEEEEVLNKKISENQSINWKPRGLHSAHFPTFYPSNHFCTGLTEDGIAQLSPAAAAASKLIKTGMTLTQIYAQVRRPLKDTLLLFSSVDRRRSGVRPLRQDLDHQQVSE
jgi:hypothetical protein